MLAAQHANLLPGGTPRGVYVYGTPRVGGERFRNDYNARLGDITYRLVHDDDIVARIPFSRIGFRHVGRMLACDSGEKFAASAPLSDRGCEAPQLVAPLAAPSTASGACLRARPHCPSAGPLFPRACGVGGG